MTTHLADTRALTLTDGEKLLERIAHAQIRIVQEEAKQEGSYRTREKPLRCEHRRRSRHRGEPGKAAYHADPGESAVVSEAAETSDVVRQFRARKSHANRDRRRRPGHRVGA